MVLHTDILLPCSLRKHERNMYGDGKKNRVPHYCRFWLYYTQNMKKSHFSKSVCVCACVSVCLCVDFFSMANDNCRKFKQNQIIFCIMPWIVQFSKSIDFGEDRLRERGSLPATFYVLKGYFLWQMIRASNSNRIKCFCIQP